MIMNIIVTKTATLKNTNNNAKNNDARMLYMKWISMHGKILTLKYPKLACCRYFITIYYNCILCILHFSLYLIYWGCRCS